MAEHDLWWDTEQCCITPSQTWFSDGFVSWLLQRENFRWSECERKTWGRGYSIWGHVILEQYMCTEVYTHMLGVYLYSWSEGVLSVKYREQWWMRKALLPHNFAPHIQIDVYYHYTTTIKQVCTNGSKYWEACKSDPIHLESMPYEYKFQWSSSSVHNFNRPKLLESLSVFKYQAQYTAEAHVLIDPICGNSSNNFNRSTVCRELHDTAIAEPGVRLLCCLTQPVPCCLLP